MKVLFAGGNGYYPQFSGGVQSSTHHLVEQLRNQGHEASVLAALFGQGMFGLKARAKMKIMGQRAAVDSFPGLSRGQGLVSLGGCGLRGQKAQARRGCRTMPQIGSDRESPAS